MIYLSDDRMLQDKDLLHYLKNRFHIDVILSDTFILNDTQQVVVSYVGREDAIVAKNNMVKRQEYCGYRLVSVDWCSPNRGCPGCHYVNVEMLPEHSWCYSI